jgi:Tfp pilus assembly protein PilF
LGVAYLAIDRTADAREALKKAVELKPDRPAAQLEYVRLLRHLREAAAAFQVVDGVIAAGTITFDLLRERAELHRQARRLESALADIQRMLDIDPASVLAHTLRGSMLMLQGDVASAIVAYQTALAARPGMPRVRTALATAFFLLRRYDEAKQSLDTALRLKPDFMPARVNRAQLALSEGNLREGWRDLECRLLLGDDRFSPLGVAPWAGEPLAGKSILLRTEQGVGDTFQFIRFAQALKAQGARVLAECQPPACELVASARGVDVVIPRGAPIPAVDYQCPLLSLPGILGITLQNLERDCPYLFADPQRVATWRKRLQSLGKVIVGIAWQGNPDYPGDQFRSAPLTHFEELAKVPGVALVSLQKHEGLEQLHDQFGFEVHQFTSELDADGPFRDTAAIISACDLIISTDTAVAHLAGALGRPVWVALAYSPEWRWLQTGDTSPWYPTMRLFRQTSFQDWSSVFSKMATCLESARPYRREQLLPTTNSPPLRVTPVALSPAEVLDKFLILELKQRFSTTESHQESIRHELASLQEAFDAYFASPDQAWQTWVDKLQDVNQRLWNAEDQIRACERRNDFGPRFVELARTIYQTNDQRSDIKRQINAFFGMPAAEVKIYRDE